VEALTCVEVSDQFDDEYGRYRQTSFMAIKADCRDIMTRFAMLPDGIAIDETIEHKFEIVVWPTREPQFAGQLVDLDAGATSVSVIGQGEFTLRVSEKATNTGFAFNAPAVDGFTCVTLDNTNYDDFVTGYQQWKFTAKDD
jgi:hypothetical protein